MSDSMPKLNVDGYGGAPYPPERTWIPLWMAAQMLGMEQKEAKWFLLFHGVRFWPKRPGTPHKGLSPDLTETISLRNQLLEHHRSKSVATPQIAAKSA